jgi:NTE family protein
MRTGKLVDSIAGNEEGQGSRQMKIRFRNLNSMMREIGEKVQCVPGEKIIPQGLQNRFFFLITAGHVEMSVEGQEKKQLGRFSPSQYFGEISCLTEGLSGAAYVALDRVSLLRTDRDGLLKLVDDLPGFSRHIIETLSCLARQGGSCPEACISPFPEEKSRWDRTGEIPAPSPGSAGRPRIGLALGAGVVRGMAHIGVVRSLEKNGVPVDMVAGTSAGAVVGACLAAGIPADEMERIARGMRWSKIAAPLLPPGKAFLNNEKLGQLMDDILQGKNFSDLNMPFAVVAADACTGEEVVIREGKISEAVRASAAIPAIFEPVTLFGRTLVDGAAVNMLPASVCRTMGADIVIAVSVCDFTFQAGPPRNIIMAILRFNDMMLKQQVISSETRWADIVISVKRPDLRGYSFRDARRFIREGEKAADQAVQRAKAIIGMWRG